VVSDKKQPILFLYLAIEKIVKESLKVSKNGPAKTELQKFSSSEVNIACSPP
jgi:hypothetical protein